MNQNRHFTENDTFLYKERAFKHVDFLDMGLGPSHHNQVQRWDLYSLMIIVCSDYTDYSPYNCAVTLNYVCNSLTNYNLLFAQSFLDAYYGHTLPLEVVQGTIGHLQVTVDLTALFTQPIIVKIEVRKSDILTLIYVILMEQYKRLLFKIIYRIWTKMAHMTSYSGQLFRYSDLCQI